MVKEHIRKRQDRGGSPATKMEIKCEMDLEEEEPDMLKDGIEVVFGKKRYRDLLMQN